MMHFNIFKNTVLFPKIIGIVLILISCGNISKTEDGRRKSEDGKQKNRVEYSKLEISGLKLKENKLNTEYWQLNTILVGNF